MKTLILPAAGKSTRFPGTRPKWLLTHPNGCTMLEAGVRGMPINQFDKIVIVMLEEHYNKYNPPIRFDHPNVVYHLIQASESQPSTIAQAVENMGIEGQIVCKDCDNSFKLDNIPDGNSVGYINLHNVEGVKAYNKSYIELNTQNIVQNIAEKKMISDKFCVGLYSFADAQDYLRYFKSLENNSGLYVSHIIYRMMLDKEQFTGAETSHFVDWGTIEDWQQYKSTYATLFVDIDGTLLISDNLNRQELVIEKTTALDGNIKKLQELYKAGRTQIILTTARPWSDSLVDGLVAFNIPYDKLITNCLHAKRILINDFAPSNPYPSAQAINLPRDTNTLPLYI